MTAVHAALAFLSLLVIVDPVALAPVFAALTGGMDAGQRRRVALKAVAAGFALIALAGVAGPAALRAIGAEAALAHVVLAAALLALGLAMLLGRGLDGLARAGRRDPSLIPLATPLIAGPGAMGAMVMFAGRDEARIGLLYAILAAVAVVTYAVLGQADRIADRLGARGVRLVTRALGLVLIGAAGRFLIEGLRDYGVLGGAGGA